MKTRTLLLTTVFALSAGLSHALTNDQIIADLKADGFTRIEIKTGPTQVKAEAIRGTEKHEIVYDVATGAVLKMEIETVEAGEDTRPGVEVEIEDRDFVGNPGGDDSTDDEDDTEDDSDDREEGDDHSDDSDDGADDSDDRDEGDEGDDRDEGDDSDDRDDDSGDDSGDDDSGKGGSGKDD